LKHGGSGLLLYCSKRQVRKLYTAQDIFNMSIAIKNDLSETGLVTDDETAEFKHRAPYLLDAWQKELADIGALRNTTEFENTDEGKTNQWVKYSQPANLKSIKQVLFEDSDEQPQSIRYRTFGKSDIYFYFTEIGTVKMLYITVPVKITSLSQTLEVDDTTAMSGAYYLAEQFATSEEEDSTADLCKRKFNELKNELSKEDPLSPEEIIDVY